jgi:long-chain acyl-CoA synthetase
MLAKVKGGFLMGHLKVPKKTNISPGVKKNKTDRASVNDLTINKILDAAVNQHQDKIFCVSHEHPECALSFNKLKQRVDVERVYFAKKKQVVAFFLQNSITFLINFLAVVCNGGIAVIVDARNEIEFALKQLNDVKPNIIVTTREAADRIIQVWIESKFDYPLPEFKIVTLNDSFFKENEHETPKANITLPSASPDSLAIILYTSGSIGHPKGVMLTHSEICNSVYENIKNVNKNYIDCQVAMAPFSHIVGLTAVFLSCLLMGVKTVFVESVKPTVILSAIKQHKAQSIVVPPIFLEMIYRKITEKIDHLNIFKRMTIKLFQIFVFIISYFSLEYGSVIARKLFNKIISSISDSLVVFYSAGAGIPKKVSRTLFSFGFIIVNCYGLSETSGAVAMNDNIFTLTKSVGRINSNITVKIENPDQYGVGEIYIKSNQLFNGYYNNQFLTNSCLKDGWFDTGDLGYLDKENYLYVVGRSKEVIVTAEGKKIYPADLEEFFMDAPRVERVCAFGLRVNDNDHIAICFHICSSDSFSNDKKNIIQFVSKKNNKLPSYMRIQHIFVESEPMPISKNGKIIKNILVEKYQKLLKTGTK